MAELFKLVNHSKESEFDAVTAAPLSVNLSADTDEGHPWRIAGWQRRFPNWPYPAAFHSVGAGHAMFRCAGKVVLRIGKLYAICGHEYRIADYTVWWSPVKRPYCVMYHGTFRSNLAGIKKLGLLPMAKDCIYFSPVWPSKGLVPGKGDSPFLAVVMVHQEPLIASGLYDIYQRSVCFIAVPRKENFGIPVEALAVRAVNHNTGNWEIHHWSVVFLFKPPFIWYFPAIVICHANSRDNFFSSQPRSRTVWKWMNLGAAPLLSTYRYHDCFWGPRALDWKTSFQCFTYFTLCWSKEMIYSNRWLCLLIGENNTIHYYVCLWDMLEFPFVG